jgi:hypothetical protein
MDHVLSETRSFWYTLSIRRWLVYEAADSPLITFEDCYVEVKKKISSRVEPQSKKEGPQGRKVGLS